MSQTSSSLQFVIKPPKEQEKIFVIEESTTSSRALSSQEEAFKESLAKRLDFDKELVTLKSLELKEEMKNVHSKINRVIGISGVFFGVFMIISLSQLLIDLPSILFGLSIMPMLVSFSYTLWRSEEYQKKLVEMQKSLDKLSAPSENDELASKIFMFSQHSRLHSSLKPLLIDQFKKLKNLEGTKDYWNFMDMCLTQLKRSYETEEMLEKMQQGEVLLPQPSPKSEK